MTNTLSDLKKRKGKRRAAPRGYKLYLPMGYNSVPGRDGKTLSKQQIEGWGACHGCGIFSNRGYWPVLLPRERSWRAVVASDEQARANSRRAMSSHKKRARSEGTSDRVFLNVGGEVFQTTISTLTANSQFFSRKFSSEWSTEDTEDEIFLDRDADSFRVLLSCMRHRTALLPEEDQLLCARVLLEYIQSGSNPRL